MYIYIYTFSLLLIQKQRTGLLTSPVLVSEIRKPPDIAETHSVPDTREDELQLSAPSRATCVNTETETSVSQNKTQWTSLKVHTGGKIIQSMH